MPADDTIAAIATAPGQGAVGIVRVSGPGTVAIAQRLIGRLPAARHASYQRLRDADGRLIDDVIVIYFAGPGSFTGEDTLEIQTHGGDIVPRAVLNSVIAAGARAAQPGEFSLRAFLNGKIDLLQAEAIADLISSTSVRAAQLAQRSLAGEFSLRVNRLSKALKRIRVQLEAAIDFPEEAIPADTVARLAMQTQQIRDDINSLLDTAQDGARLNRGVDVAIVGEPNVGKSTLLNRLAGVDRAIVNDAPGTTRDVLSIDIDIDGLAMRVHDTAGFRNTTDPVEMEGVRRARQQLIDADAVLYVYSDDKEPQIALPESVTAPVFLIKNKIDMTGEAPSLTRHEQLTRVFLSAKTGAGIPQLTEAILGAFHLNRDNDSTLLARDRHLIALAEASEVLSFDYAALYGATPELGAEHLRLAGAALGRLTGEFTSDDLLGEIFSTFCLGK